MTCEYCSGEFKRNEKVVGMTQGRHLGRKKLRMVELYHADCYEKRFGFKAEPYELKTRTEWKIYWKDR